jgi:RES domain
MSFSTWTPAALRSEARRWRGRLWRLVEAQHRVATLKLVSSLDEQAVLEDILEETKPKVPAECRHLDYLLATPFRYGPYPRGSRFRRAGRTPGVWYGAEAVATAVAEMVFYRFLFFAEAPDVIWPDAAAEYTAIASRLEGRRLDLTVPPLDRDADHWRHPTDYSACQALADAAREANAQMIRYHSVRARDGSCNVAVLQCAAFADPAPVDRRTWRIRLGPFGALALCDYPTERLAFAPDAFDDPRLSGMKWSR